MLRLEPRSTPSFAFQLLAPLLAITITMVLGALLFALLGKPPFGVLYAFFIAPISDSYGLAEIGVKATPLALIAIGLAFGFRANVWNIGAEGQLTMGAIVGGGLALAYPEAPGFILLPAMMLGGIVGGGIWGSVPALLKVRFNANEILTSLMLTYIALLLLSYLVHGPWKDPEGFAFPESRLFSAGALLPIIISDTRLHLGFYIALGVVAIGWLTFSRLFLGFQIRVSGAAVPAARLAGFSSPKLTWITLGAAGALAGLAGVFEIAGPIGQLLPSVSPGYGFTAIIVAFLGRLHPLGIALAALLVALSYLGSESAQISHGLPQAAAGLFQGLLLFMLLGFDVLVRYRLVPNRRFSPPG